MEQPKETTAKAEAERFRGLRYPGQRSVIEAKPFKRVTQHWIVNAIDRIEPGKHHGLRRPVARKRQRGWLIRLRNGFPPRDVLDDFKSGGNVATSPRREVTRGMELR